MSLSALTNRRLCQVATGGSTVRIVLLRHAQPAVHGCFCGHSDPGLSAQGREQIPGIIHILSEIVPGAIWSSDLRRATETAQPVAEYFGLTYKTSPGFREMYFGSWEGLSWNEVELQYPEDARAWAELYPHHRPPGGESFLELQARTVGQLEDLANHAEPGCALVFTHAGFIRAAVGWIFGMPDDRISRIALNYGAITILEKVGNHWSVAALNLSTSLSSTATVKQTEEQL